MNNPKKMHSEAVKHIGRYLLGTRIKGYVLQLNSKQKLECYMDADFASNGNPTTAGNDPAMARSRTGFLVTYAKAPIYWQSKLQTQYALSTAESKLLAL